MAEGALSHLKVLDIGHYIAGPYCAKLLADMGAEVLKIEPPEGDPARRMGPFPGDVPDAEKSGLFLYLNTNKKGITLNLKTETGRKIFKEIVKDVDVLVENFEPRVMPSLELDYETLEKINPKVVMTSISNFGQTGSYRDYKAEEITFVALGGLMDMTGDPNKEPIKEGGSIVQFTAGSNGCAATLLAVYGRKQFGVGQHVDVSILECVPTLNDAIPVLAWNRSRLRVKRWGNKCRAQLWPLAPGDGSLYRCKDGYIQVTLRLAEDMALMAALTGREEFLDPDIGWMGTNSCLNPWKVDRLLTEAFKDRSKEEIFKSAQEMRLFFGAVRNVEDIFNSEHYRERGFWAEVDHPVAGRVSMPARPFIMSETPVNVGRSPLLGEYNEEIYCERLGYSRQDLTRMREMGVI